MNESEAYAQLKHERDAIRLLFDRLLKAVGQPGACRGCGAPIVWVTHRNGIHTPYDPNGVNHFATCPNAKPFQKSSPRDPSRPVKT